MMPTIYSVSDAWRAPHDVPAVDNFAVVVGNRMVMRERSNGQTFAMTYKTERHALRGLAAAREHFPGVTLWRRDED